MYSPFLCLLIWFRLYVSPSFPCPAEILSCQKTDAVIFCSCPRRPSFCLYHSKSWHNHIPTPDAYIFPDHITGSPKIPESTRVSEPILQKPKTIFWPYHSDACYSRKSLPGFPDVTFRKPIRSKSNFSISCRTIVRNTTAQIWLFPFLTVLQLRKYGYKTDFLFYNRITFPDCTSET